MNSAEVRRDYAILAIWVRKLELRMYSTFYSSYFPAKFCRLHTYIWPEPRYTGTTKSHPSYRGSSSLNGRCTVKFTVLMFPPNFCRIHTCVWSEPKYEGITIGVSHLQTAGVQYDS
jgi:hypothetical protein